MAASFHVGLLPNRPAAEVAELARYAEGLGFDGVWVADSQSVFREAYQTLALCATVTNRVKLATGVTNPLTRHPAVLASSFATLDELSGGRAVIGMGVGESSVHTTGLRPAKLATMEEVGVAVRALAAGERVRFRGEELHLTWCSRRVPLYFASSGPRSLQLAGRVADGVLFQVGALPGMVRYAIDTVCGAALSAGRAIEDVRPYCRLACSISDDRAWAREEVQGYAAAAAGTVFTSVPSEVMPSDLREEIRRMKERYDYFEHASQSARHKELMTAPIVDAISISGAPREAIPRFQELIDLGVEGFVTPITSSDPEGSMRALAEDVIPHLR